RSILRVRAVSFCASRMASAGTSGARGGAGRSRQREAASRGTPGASRRERTSAGGRPPGGHGSVRGASSGGGGPPPRLGRAGVGGIGLGGQRGGEEGGVGAGARVARGGRRGPRLAARDGQAGHDRGEEAAHGAPSIAKQWMTATRSSRGGGSGAYWVSTKTP